MIHKKMFQHLIRFGALIVVLTIIIAFGLVVAKTVTRPLDVQLRTHIKICQKTEKGAWEVIDEVGPANLTFRANLLELATGKKISTDYVWTTKTKKGRPYSVRLLDQAGVDLNPVTGKLESDLILEVKYSGKTAKVPVTLTTESRLGPLGNLKGKRASGILGRNPTTVTLVSANKFQPDRKSQPLMLVCTEEYKLSPRK